MDWTEDKILLEKLEKCDKLELRHREIAELKEQLVLKQKELDHRFKIITEQSDIIKRYRCLIKTLKLDEVSTDETCPKLNAPLPIVVPPEVKVIVKKRRREEEESESSDSSVSDTTIRDSDQVGKPETLAKEDKPHSKLKMRRLNEIAEQNQIKCPTADDMSYKDTAIGQTIWSTIIKCFRKYPGGMITENMIIEEGGKHVFNPNQYFLDKKMIHKYFTHPFKYKDNDRKMSIRPVLMANGITSWMVLIPDWLKAEFRHEMSTYTPPT